MGTVLKRIGIELLWFWEVFLDMLYPEEDRPTADDLRRERVGRLKD